MPKQLNVNLAFTADTGKAAAGIKSLQQQLTQLMNTANINSNSLGLTKDIKEATAAAAQLKTTLNNAMNANGTLDLTKFNDSLKASGMTLEQYRIKLSALGPEGTQAFSQLASQISSAEIPLKRANTLLQNMGTTLMNTARWQLSSSLLHGFIGGLQSAYGYAQDLNESLNNIRIVTGQSTEQMAQLAQKANQAAQQLSTRTTDYTNASLIYYQQGLDDKAVEERTRTTLKLSNVTRQSAEEVANQMTAIWNNFDDGTKSLEYYADAITALGAKTASSSSEIADGLSKFASIADTVGLSYEYATAALATVVAETRQSADTVGNAFKSLFARIQSLKLGETLEDGVGLTKYTQALETVGVQVLDINGNLRDADDILSDLGERWQNISSAQKAALAQTVAGQRQYAQMIALMDNWDKVKENVGIASESEGTLQEQQEIYAESWEASAKRVKASAEAIYDALISDDFFIGFNNVISKILDSVNNLIQGLGGLKGTLTTIGTLLTTAFSQQIASRISSIARDIAATSKKGIAEARAQQTQAIEQLKMEADTQTGSGQIAETQRVALNSQASLQQTLLDNQSKYNAEQLETAQHILDQNSSLREQAQLAAQIAEKETQKADSEQRRFLRDFGTEQPLFNENGDVDGSINIEQYVTQLRICNEEQSAVANSATTLGGILSGTFESPEQKAEAFTTQMNQVSQSVAKLGSIPELSQFTTEVENAMEALRQDPSEQNMQNVIQRLRELSDAANQTGNNIEDNLVTGLTNAGQKSEEVSGRVTGMVNSFKQAGEATADLTNKTEAMKAGAEAGADSLNKMGSESMKASQMITGISSDIMLLASVINTIKSTIDILNNEDLTFAEKMMRIIPALLVTTAMLTKTLTGMGGAALVAAAGHLPLIGTYISEAAAAAGATATTLSLGAAIKFAVPLLAGIGAAIAGVVAIVGVVVKTLDDAFETPAERAERLQKEVENTTTALENTTTAAENLKTAFDEYDSAREALDNCEEGTSQWYDALNNVNDKVLEILDLYPQLSQFLTVGENGELTLSEEGIEGFKNQQQKNINSIKAANLAAQYSQQENDADIEREEIAKQIQDALLGDEGTILSEALYAAGIDLSDGVRGIVDQLAENEIKITDITKNLESTDLEGAIRQYAFDHVYGGLGTGAWNMYNATDLTEKDENGNYKMDLDTLKEGILSNGSMGETWDEVEAFISNQLETVSDETKAAWADIDAAVAHYTGSLAGLASVQEAYGKTLGESIVAQNKELQDNPYLDKVMMLSDKLYQSNFDQVRPKYDDQNISVDDFSKFIKQNDFVGFNEIKKGENGGITYEDNEGTVYELSQTAIKNMMAAAEAQQMVADAAVDVVKKFEELETSGDKTKEAFSDFLSTGKFERSGNSLKKSFEDTKEQKGYNDKQAAEAILDQMLGNGKDDKIAESTAQKYGYETKEAMINAFLKGLESWDNDVAEARDTGSEFLNKYYQNIVDGAKDSIDDLDLSDQIKIGDLLKQALDSGGYDGLKAMQDVLINTSDLQGIIEGLTGDGINWASLSLEEFKDRLASLGVQIEDIKTDSLEDLFRTLKQIGEISFESATSTFKSLHEVVDGLKQGDTIKAEDYETLMNKMDPQQLEEFFTPMADGTYKLIGDAETFYDTVNKLSVEEFKQGWQQEATKAKTAKELQSKDAYGSDGQGTKTIDFGEGGTREVGLFDSAYGETSTGAYSFSKTLVEDQLTYLNLLNLTEEEYDQIRTIEADLRDGKGLEEQQLENLNTLMQNHKSQWEEVAEAQTTAEKNSENYIKMMASSAPDLQSLKAMFDQGDFEETGKSWKDIAGIWKNIFPEEDVQNNIKTLDDFKKSITEVDGAPAAITNSSLAWHKLKNSIKLTVDDLNKFVAMKDDISPEDFAEGIKQIAASATNIEELNSVMAIGEDLGIDFTDQIISLLNQSDMTTEEHIKAIIDQLRQGHGEASKLAQEISRLSAENDDEQTTKEAQAERQSNYDQAKAENEAERNRINNSMSMRQEYKEQRNKELDAADRAIDIQSGLDDITAAANAKDMFPTDQLAMFEQGLERIGNKADLTTIQIRQIGEAATSIVSGSDFFSIDQQLSSIKDAFSVNGVIDESNLKAYADSVKDIVLNTNQLNLEEKISTLTNELEAAGVPAEYLDREIADLILEQDNLTLQEKIALLEQNLTGALTPAMYLKDHIDELLNASGGSTEDQIESLNTLLEEGLIKASQYSDKMYGLLEQSDYDAETQQYLANSTYQTEIAAAKEKIPERQDQGDYSFDMQAYQAAYQQYKEDIDSAQQSYVNWVKTIDATEFKSFDKLLDFFSAIPEGIDVSKQLAEVYRDYGDQFENAATEVEALDKALRSGNEAQIQQAQVAYESAVRAGEAAAQYGLNAEYLEVLSDHIRELNPDLADSLEVVNQLAVEQARLNVAMEDINDNGDQYIKTFEELSKYGKESVLANSDLSKSYEGMRKTAANMLNVSEDFADELLNNKENAEDFEAALKGDEKAIQRLNKTAAKETIHKLGLDDDDFLNGVDSALAHLDELPEGKDIVLNVDTEGYDEQVANLITKMAEAENAIGGTITDLQEDLQGVDLGVEFELVPPEELEDAKKSGDLLVEMAGDISDRAYSAMEGGTEAEVNTETTETKDEVEPPPDQEATVTQVDGWISSMTGGGGTAGEGGTGMNPVEVMNKPVTFPSVKYNATPETPETVEKADTVNTYRVKKAAPTNAGNVSHSNKTNRGGGGCFAAGTLISTNQGYKKIEDIQVGDIVLSYSLKNNQNEYSKVLQTMIHKITGNMYFIYVDGDVIESTEIHKFLIIRGNKAEWIAASDLKVSDLVYFADGTLHKIEMIKVKEKTLIVYNFEVDGNHNYYVGNNQILVHNKGGGCFIAGTLVMAKEGYKNIEDIQKGDIVLSFNEKKNQNEYSEVLNTMTHIVNENIYTLYIEDEKLIVTGIHRFLIIRKRAKGWVHASDLLIGDLVLFADGTWHEIHKIDVNVELKIVYNFEVSKNHNYYVGKNQILAHNKGRRGGGGSRPTGSAKVRAAAAHKEHEERYHVLDKKLGTLADSYKDVTSAKDRAFGSKHLKNIESEISLLEKEIAVQKDYRKEVEKFLKIDKASISKADQKGLTATELKDYEDRKASYQAIDVEKIKFKTKGKGNKWTAKESEINTKVDVSGYGGPVNFDANGNITNIEELKEAATAKYNQAAQDYASQHVDIGDISTKSKKKWKAEVKRQATITNEWNKAQAMYEQYMANLDKYEETLALKRQKITEAIEKEVNLIQAKLEKTSYQVEVKANIDDMSLKIINHALDMMGDKARNATARLGQLAEQLKTLNSTSSKMDRNGKKSNTGPGALSDNVWAISDILSNVTSSYKTITDNNGDIQYFNKENAKDSDYLNGNDLVKKMMAGGDSAKEVVNIIGKQQNITKDQFEKMMEYATSELERIQQMKEIRLQMFDIMSQAYDEETEKMDRLLDKQSFYMERANGYKNVLDIIGRANFAYDETKYSNGREAGRDLEEQIDNALLTQSQERIKTIDREKQNQESLRKLTADNRTNAQNFIKALEATPDTLKDLDEDQKKIYDANFTEWSGYSDQQKKDAIEQWKQDIDAFDEQIQKADDKIDELTLEKQTAFEDALTLTEENWERAMERAKEAFEQAMAGAASSLELLLNGLDRYDKTHSTMVADYEKVYQLRNLELQAQESIDKANDPRIKRELLSIQEEITAASTQDKKMSQYELDYLRQKLELKEAEAALEDAQKAKTQVSLTRDNEGNFGYVYTADDTAVDDAEKNYADKIYEMRKTNQEYIQSLQAELAQAQQDAINAIMEINGRKDLTPEERDAEIAKISEDYHALHTNLIDQLNLALTNSNDVFGQYSELYSQITGDTMALNVDYVKDFTETQYSIQTGWTSTQQVANAFGDQMNTLLGEGGTLSKINAAYEANNKTTFENAGQDISTFAKDSVEALTGENGLNKAVQSLTGDMETLGKTATENFGNVLDKVKEIEEDFTTYIGAMETSVTNLASALRDAALAMTELEDETDTAATTTTTGGGDDDGGDGKKNTPSGGKRYKYYGSRSKRVRKTITTKRQANRLGYRAAKAVLSKKQEDAIKKKYRTRSAQKRAMIKKAKSIVKKQLKTNKFAGVKIRFDTGGYTGDWSGNDGRVAMLHKKEMVLNQQDTSNILSAVGMIRDIAQKIDLNALSQSGALSSGISGINGVSNGTLEQEVHITAEFPNATDRNEISEAFNNIIGLAAQYANR